MNGIGLLCGILMRLVGRLTLLGYNLVNQSTIVSLICEDVQLDQGQRVSICKG
jgi:hypothetical protein